MELNRGYFFNLVTFNLQTTGNPELETRNNQPAHARPALSREIPTFAPRWTVPDSLSMPA